MGKPKAFNGVGSDYRSVPQMMSKSNRIAAAVDAFGDGEPVLVYDAADRESEVDIVYPPENITHADIARLRNDAGGLICVALSDTVCRTLGLPFLRETIDHPVAVEHDRGYGDRSASSLSVNHIDTFTGITDADRALTIRNLSACAATPDVEGFAEEFRTPGHVRLLRAAPGLLDDRQGHTELGVAIARAADCPPAAVVCEMLDDESGDALSRAAAKEYANREGLVYVEATTLVDYFA